MGLWIVLRRKVETWTWKPLEGYTLYCFMILTSMRVFDARPLGNVRPTKLNLGVVHTTDGSAIAKIGKTKMMGRVKLKAMTPTDEYLDDSCIVMEFKMPPIHSPHVQPGRLVDLAVSVSEAFASLASYQSIFHLAKWTLRKTL
ncbi:hypothetical protein SUGI_0034420 [Cryptomeria japonica]|nr:hypothetical protein SUGI_0034420 [Cryptomeria japonica]